MMNIPGKTQRTLTGARCDFTLEPAPEFYRQTNAGGSKGWAGAGDPRRCCLRRETGGDDCFYGRNLLVSRTGVEATVITGAEFIARPIIVKRCVPRTMCLPFVWRLNNGALNQCCIPSVTQVCGIMCITLRDQLRLRNRLLR